MEITKHITKRNIRIDKLLVVVLGVLLLYSCATSTYTPTKKHKNLSYLYNETEAFLHPQFQIYNFSEDSSEVFVKIPSEDLLIRDLKDGSEKYALLELHFRLYESLSVLSLLDSLTITQKIVIFEEPQDIQFSFKIKSPRLSISYLRVKLKDVFSERKRQDYIEIDKTKSINRQSLLVENRETQLPVFGNELLIGQQYRIESPLFKKYPSYIRQSKRINVVPNLPFSTQRTPKIEFSPDTNFVFGEENISIERPGITFLTLDTALLKGVAFYTYDSLSNYLHRPSQMIEPLIYLLSNKEYKGLRNDTNPKFALDRFWLKHGENTRHAKEMLKVYYSRTATANQYFSSFKKGWMTDRGMIYIIYGEPAKIYKSSKLERWIYGSEESDVSLIFDFDKKINPLSDNDFELLRNESYQKSWFQAVDAWRNGRIYSIAK